MQSNFSILQKYTHVALFVFYEIIALTLLVNFNTKQNEIFLHSSALFSGSLMEETSKIGDYLDLKESNNDLLAENARLLDEVISAPRPLPNALDTAEHSYEVIPSRVINNSIQTKHNFFTIDKGRKDGIAPNMGVITSEGVAGIVKQVSSRYATVLSVLHLDSKISASIDDQDFFGFVSWDGQSFQRLSLSGIPKYVTINKGQIIETNGHSTIFPAGIPIGTIEAYDISKNGVFFDIVVVPRTDFAQLGHVYVLKDNFATERLSLEANE